MEYTLTYVRVFVTDSQRAIHFYTQMLGMKAGLISGRGVEFVNAPEKQSWGGWLAHLRDPDTNVLTLLGTHA